MANTVQNKAKNIVVGDEVLARVGAMVISCCTRRSGSGNGNGAHEPEPCTLRSEDRLDGARGGSDTARGGCRRYHEQRGERPAR